VASSQSEPPTVNESTPPYSPPRADIFTPERAPVAVRGLFFQDRVPLAREASGDWSGTVGPVEPGLYEYSF
jgi:hypothetical protein